MTITDVTGGNSKVAAKLKNLSGRIKSNISVTVSEHSPESIQLTGYLPRSQGWKLETKIPLKENGRKDYFRFLQDTREKEIWIKVSTAGGRSKVYLR